MLSNQITLSVDATGANASFSDEVLDRFRESENKTEYRFADHTLSARNQCDFYRNVITPSGNYLGNAKGSFKFTEDVTVLAKDGTDVVTPIIVQVSYSIPVGATEAEFLHTLGRVQAMVLEADLMTDLFTKQNI